MTMHVLELSYMYPSPRHPTSGVFVERQVRELSRLVAVDVVSPVPWSPRPLWTLSPRWRAYGRQPRETVSRGVRVHHPRYAQPIGQWSVPVVGVTMAAGAGRLSARLARERGADVIHAHQLLPEGLAAVLLARRLGRPVVCALHGLDVTTVPFHDPIARAAARYVVRRCRAFTAVNENLLQPLARLAPHAEAAVIPNGVDIRQFRPLERSAARVRLGLAADRPLVLYAGAFTAGKGVDLLLEAFARIVTRVPSAELVLVGGSAERNDRGTALAERAAALGCARRVRWVGRRPHEEMPVWFSAADVFALASWREGFPNVVREALACGTPCVATALPGIAEAVGPDGGYVVAPGDIEGLATALGDALRRSWDRRALRGRALGWSWERNAKDTLDVLARVAEPGVREVA